MIEKDRLTQVRKELDRLISDSKMKAIQYRKEQMNVLYKELEKTKSFDMDNELALQLMCKTYTNDAFYRPIGAAMRTGDY